MNCIRPTGMLLALLLILIAPVQGQSERLDNLPTDRPKIFNLLFQRGFLIASEGAEEPAAPINTFGSGTYFLAASLKANLARGRFGFRFQPGFAWTLLTYEQRDSKTFPSPGLDNKFTLERHRLNFLEMPVGIFVNITKDEDGDPRFFLEGGGYAGYRVGSAYKVKYENAQGQEVKEVAKGVRDVQDFRYGLYARIGYKWGALFATWRLSDVFTAERTDGNGQPTGEMNPEIPRFEVGIVLIL